MYSKINIMSKWLLLSGLCCCVNLFAADSDGDGLRRAGRYYRTGCVGQGTNSVK